MAVNARLIADSIFGEFVGQLHATRARKFVENELAPNVSLVFRSTSLVEVIVTLCESHAWGVRESHDPINIQHAIAQLPPHKRISSVRLNLQSLACSLRLADVLD